MNLVINTDRVLCAECLDELKPGDLNLDNADYMVMGESSAPCDYCGRDADKLASGR